MKTFEKKTQSAGLNKVVIKKTINESQKHPYLEKKLEQANLLLKKVGLPKNW